MSQHSNANTAVAFDEWARQIASETGFVLGEKIYQGTYYSADFVRNAIWRGDWKGKPAVLKAYDDPRMSDEPRALAAFHASGASSVLRAPALYASRMESPKRGWLIMERLPEGGSFFPAPLAATDISVFVDLYIQYRAQFPSVPTRPLTLLERLPAHEYHRQRIASWFRLATDREEQRRMNGEPLLLEPAEFLMRHDLVLAALDAEFKCRDMNWCHGHFKSNEVYRDPAGGYILTDFAHSKMYPQGYELAFMVWADWLMAADWRMPYEQWKQGVDTWLAAFRARQDTFGLKRLNDLLRASMLERCLGTVLADLTASDRPREELEARLQLLLKLMDDLLD
jgi:hypothetical protein